ncbi:MAG: MBL fold metallo-hydrolase [Nanoarchaeota archaeon]
MVKIHFLGGCQEVGRNAFLVDSTKRIMLDYGMHVEDQGRPLMPKGKVDYCFMSHGHLDHLGSSAILHKEKGSTFFGTAPTVDFTNLLLRDSLKIANIEGINPGFNHADILKLNKCYEKVEYGDDFKLGGYKIKIWEAGHIPGAIMTELHVEDKTILYTGDFKTNPGKLVNGAKYSGKDVDALIMENTYATREQPPREKTEKEFIKAIEETCENGGIALLPSFAIRAPEILMVLNKYKLNYPIYLDGMSRAATEISLAHPNFIKDHDALRKATDIAIPIEENEERSNAMKEPCVIVTTSGAMEGGPVVHYMKHLYSRKDCSLVFTGYQIPGTASRYLADTGRFIIGPIDFKVKMKMHSFSFSAHADRTELIKFIQKIRPKKCFMIHGDYSTKFATEIKGRFGIDAMAPHAGDTVKI